MKNPNDLETIRNIILINSDDEEDIALDEIDADEEHISEGEVIEQAKNLTDILDVWKCLITDCIIESIVYENNKYICSWKPNYFRSKNARDTDGAEIKDLLDLFYLVGCLAWK
ncbi:hypothetical protein NPIL_695851 [Nephila pilipes]|uniref:Uncharacterized protein n=1 Tax=Nephila pilipes TaxID=299642 RepID=A0A8X6NV66_NEPPI|nr:hypothetical protein NPIL_695851 [Nephila pilipes]